MKLFPVLQNISRAQKTGALLLLFLVLFAFVQPLILPHSPSENHFDRILQAPSLHDPLGTDFLGRSMLARIAAAIRLSLSLAVICVVSAVVPGVFLGVLAGWHGGKLDRLISLAADAIAALPGLLLILLIASLAPGNFLVLYLAIALVLYLEFFRVVRAQTRVLVVSKHLEASQALGFSSWYCFRRHIWPGLLPSLLPLAALGAGNAILALATLGYINVGLRPPVAELGLMMTELSPYIYQAPGALLLPILTVFSIVLSLNLLTIKGRT